MRLDEIMQDLDIIKDLDVSEIYDKLLGILDLGPIYLDTNIDQFLQNFGGEYQKNNFVEALNKLTINNEACILADKIVRIK